MSEVWERSGRAPRDGRDQLVEALAFAANALAGWVRTMEAGWLVLTGGMTGAVPLIPGRRSPHSSLTSGRSLSPRPADLGAGAQDRRMVVG